MEFKKNISSMYITEHINKTRKTRKSKSDINIVAVHHKSISQQQKELLNPTKVTVPKCVGIYVYSAEL